VEPTKLLILCLPHPCIGCGQIVWTGSNCTGPQPSAEACLTCTDGACMNPCELADRPVFVQGHLSLGVSSSAYVFDLRAT
jgi:hypothetical protein